MARTGPSSPWGCLTEQAEGIPKEVASASKINISQAPAAFGKLLLGKSHMNHPVSSQQIKTTSVNKNISAIVLIHLHTGSFRSQKL